MAVTGPSTHHVTRLLVEWTGGDQAALEQLTPLVYGELHRIARRQMGQERPGHTLQATALVNEAYLRLVDIPQVKWQDRVHFFALAARLMRRILVDFARSRGYQKRGGGVRAITLNDELVGSGEQVTNLVAIDEALQALAAFDERSSRVVELRFFGGLTVKETADVLAVSPETVMRDWKLAKNWLLRDLAGPAPGRPVKTRKGDDA
jgi:RNA polymerase sigma-70 factor (ECF subfamily)